MRPGGFTTVPVEMIVQRPIAMLVDADLLWLLASLGSGGGLSRVRSPRSTTSAWMTVRPPRVMFAVPEMLARRDTLLPESYKAEDGLERVETGCR